MELATITMDRTAARAAFLDYRRAVRERHDAEDEQIMRGYRELARGSQLIHLTDTMRASGFIERRNWQNYANLLPRLAIARATSLHAWTYGISQGRESLVIASRDLALINPRATRDRLVFPRGSFELPATDVALGWSNMWRAMTPLIPPGLRPSGDLNRFHILWEANWERAVPPRPPGDPALLRHIGGDLYAVLACWDLTDLERAVLTGRRS